MTTRCARLLLSDLAISKGEVSQAVASLTFPSGSVTLIGTRGFSTYHNQLAPKQDACCILATSSSYCFFSFSNMTIRCGMYSGGGFIYRCIRLTVKISTRPYFQRETAALSLLLGLLVFLDGFLAVLLLLVVDAQILEFLGLVCHLLVVCDCEKILSPWLFQMSTAVRSSTVMDLDYNFACT